MKMKHTVKYYLKEAANVIISSVAGFAAETAVLKVTNNNLVAGTGAYLAVWAPTTVLLTEKHRKDERDELIQKAAVLVAEKYEAADRENPDKQSRLVSAKKLDGFVSEALDQVCADQHMDVNMIELGRHTYMVTMIAIKATEIVLEHRDMADKTTNTKPTFEPA